MTKKKLKVKKIFLFLLIVLILCLCVFVAIKIIAKLTKEAEKKEDAYIGSLDYSVQLYNIEDYTEQEKITRGTKVSLYEKDVIQVLDNGTKEKEDDKEVVYRKVAYKDNLYLVKPESIVKTLEESVYEKERYVRTSLTLYTSAEDILIAGYAKKGTKLEITGFDKINEDGSINMYKVKNGETDAYVYPKYLTATEEEALANYNENGTYDIHKNRKFSYNLFGGSAANLDYYPYEHPTFEGNELLADSKTYYLNAGVLGSVDAYIEVAKNAGANAFVIDIKDDVLAYKSPVAEKYTPTSFNRALFSVEDYKAAIDKIKAAGFYTIGRIVLFNDSTYAGDNPSDCINAPGGGNTGWVSAYSRRAWEYNVKLALESIELFGFNEMQFDYVRFPESSYNWSKNGGYDFKNAYSEEKAQAIQTFLYYATDEIHKMNTYISIDVFGECSSTYVTAYGQYWPAISNIVDVISGMPYPDHFAKGSYGLKYPWEYPYSLMKSWGTQTLNRQKEIPTPAKVRTWIQAYKAIHDPYINYGAEELYQQIKGLKDSGLGGGFITWNGKSDISKYRAIAPAFSREY